MKQGLSIKEQRRSSRLKLAIPVFVRSQTAEGQELLEFATAVNVSAGGVQVVARRSLSAASWVSLEIPSAPLRTVQGMPQSCHTMRARAVWIKHLDDYHLMGLKFAHPLSTDGMSNDSRALRKSHSVV
jgi:hypothetical protein